MSDKRKKRVAEAKREGTADDLTIEEVLKKILQESVMRNRNASNLC